MPKTTVPDLGRREMLLRTVGAFSVMSAGGILEKSANAQITTVVLTPQEEQGPFFVDEKLNRIFVIVDPSDNTVQAGLPLLLNLTVSQVSNGVESPLEGAYIDIWQANAQGAYSDEASQDSSGQKYLRGYQVTNSTGNVYFVTIYPGWYSGRTPHIHVMVRLYSGSSVTFEFETQLFFNDTVTAKVYELPAYARTKARDTYNSTDRVYNYIDCDTSVTSGKELPVQLLPSASVVIAYYHLYIDLTAPKPTCVGVSDGGINEN
jgi:protocatechuate 3,4-dioxygenase beta subunit